MASTDEELVARSMGGDLDSFNQLVLRWNGQSMPSPTGLSAAKIVLQVRFMLDKLFGVAVQQPDVRIDAGHHLPVELEHQAQHAVGGRVLWTKMMLN